VNLISTKQASTTGKAAIPSKCRISGKELLELIGEMVFSEVEKGSWGRLTQTYAENTMFIKELYGQRWVNLRYDIIRKNYFRSF
jgi:hypothetical protein